MSGFVEKYWSPNEGLPGLCEAAPVIDRDISNEIDALIAEITRLGTELAKSAESSKVETGLGLRARKWLAEMHHLMKWAHRFPPDGHSPAVNVPGVLREYQRKPKRAAMLSEFISMDLRLVADYPNDFAHVPGLSPEFLAEGERLSHTLYQVRRGRSPGTPDRQAVMQRKDALLHILQDRVGRVRAAARFVFRNHPEIRKLAMSDFERKRRKRNRRSKDEKTREVQGS